MDLRFYHSFSYVKWYMCMLIHHRIICNIKRLKTNQGSINLGQIHSTTEYYTVIRKEWEHTCLCMYKESYPKYIVKKTCNA